MRPGLLLLILLLFLLVLLLLLCWYCCSAGVAAVVTRSVPIAGDTALDVSMPKVRARKADHKSCVAPGLNTVEATPPAAEAVPRYTMPYIPKASFSPSSATMAGIPIVANRHCSNQRKQHPTTDMPHNTCNTQAGNISSV